MFWFWDPTFVLLIPVLILAFWAQHKLSATYKIYSQERTMRGITGAEAARRLLDSAGLSSVNIERVSGNLSDHYDPRKRVLRLSQGVYSSDSIAAIGVAAHEVGHAIQHKNGYAPLAVRSAIVPVVNFGSFLAWPLFIIGFLLRTQPLIQIGIILFSGAVVFQLITLPVEFDASRRALVNLGDGGYLTSDELSGARRVLRAAALTYVAAATMAIVQLLRMILLSRRR
ncbi:zinc metallopeptidase [bacterium]|nr:zinc metallopeptidase [bacterium]